MKHIKKAFILLLSLALVMAMAGCGGSSEAKDSEGAEESAEEAVETGGINLKEMLTALYASEDGLGLAGKYTSISDIPDAKIDPELVGTWKKADESLTYTYNEDGTATASMEPYGDSETTFTCFACGDYNIIAEDVEMVEYLDGEEKTSQGVSYSSYKIENDVLYYMVVESPDEYSTQNITQVVALYKADEEGDILASVTASPVSLESFYGEWTYGDEGDGTFTIDENGFTLDGGETLPIACNQLGHLVIGDAGSFSEYSAALALERLYDNTDGKKLEGENFLLSVNYTGEDENDRPNLADAMTDWHAEYGYEQFYFSMNAKTPVN